ncbi:ETX/MTX2 family pore-forming toxin [Spiroplasma sp. DGKH1]|uniref:ETX/MTX2 family pore-forming toxin n=1 Tax=Spiroplasma sp. DGKH1 TaxID=3050074 RepID=UPI0034C6B2E4
MKKLISIFNVGILSTTPCFSILGSSANDVLPPSNIENLATDVDNLARQYYSVDHFINNNLTSAKYIASLLQSTTGYAEAYYTKALNSNVIETFDDTYTNNTNNNQKIKTQSYSKTITNTTSWSITGGTKTKITEKVNFIFFEGKISAELDISGGYTNTTTETETVEAPEQEFILPANKTGVVTYIIEEGTYQSDGRIRFFVSPDTLIWTSTWEDSAGGQHSAPFNLRGLVEYFKSHGYGKYFLNNYQGDSVITVDNLDNPQKISLNLPISWVSKGEKISVEYKVK